MKKNIKIYIILLLITLLHCSCGGDSETLSPLHDVGNAQTHSESSSDDIKSELDRSIDKNQNYNGWAGNSSGTFYVYNYTDCRFWNARIVVRENKTGSINVITPNHFASKLYWLTDNVFIYQVYHRKVYFYDTNVGIAVPFDSYCDIEMKEGPFSLDNEYFYYIDDKYIYFRNFEEELIGSVEIDTFLSDVSSLKHHSTEV
ncbi:MAG: hypothetical protein FWH05_04100 [Oscillospiraceae bacterium]|nr:hypothetical protein [Oscillospiraceae bacterium]